MGFRPVIIALKLLLWDKHMRQLLQASSLQVTWSLPRYHSPCIDMRCSSHCWPGSGRGTAGLIAALKLPCPTLTQVHAVHLQLALTGSGRCCAGRILNRFSSDTATVDDALPFIANLLLANLAALAGVLLVLAYTQPLLTLLVIPLGVAYLNLQASNCLPLLGSASYQIVQHLLSH